MSYFITEGNTTADAEIRFTPTGKAVASVTIMVTDGVKNEAGEWVDSAPQSYRVTVWGSPADNFTETAVKGARLVVAGELTVREYRDREGNTRVSRDITADVHGLSSRFHPATSRKAQRTNTDRAGE